ncbi:MAG: hypothetical protein CM15mP51_10610 [Porticoccaceae bacterium]|nr:MAG: hypothetical protein CM15mP51_10610 [Porticoccaceae bacterium]
MAWNPPKGNCSGLGALKNKLNQKPTKLGVYILVVKGSKCGYTPKQILFVVWQGQGGCKISKKGLSARVDKNAVQDGFNLYQQFFLLSDKGRMDCNFAGKNKRIVVQGDITGTPLPVNFFWKGAPHTGIFGERKSEDTQSGGPKTKSCRKTDRAYKRKSKRGS